MGRLRGAGTRWNPSVDNDLLGRGRLSRGVALD